MPKRHCAAYELALLLDGSSADELIAVLGRHGLLQLIEQHPGWETQSRGER
jgi:hypothetical protein